mmetsp:Transcript_6423/g.18943  ORF Transcript_6423/g.18943 Transcript_6423/m.18943 type:complete len:334 (-) Transcript_6423:12-1013(-)
MDLIGDQVNDILDLALEHSGGGNASGLFDDHGHRNSFVEQTELSLWRFLVGGVEVDASVQDGSVDVGDHGSDVAGGVRLGAVLEDLDGLLDWRVPVRGVSLVGGVDRLATVLREDHLFAGVHEFTDGAVEAESVNVAALEGEDHLDGRTVRHVPGAQAAAAGSQQIVDGAVAAGLLLVDAEDGADADVAVDVGTSVEGIERDAEFARLAGRDDDGLLVLLGHQHAAHARIDQRVDHHIVRQDIQLLLIVAGAVDLACQTVQLGNSSTLHGGRDELARCGNGIHQDHQIVIMGGCHDKTIQRFGVAVKFVGHGCSVSSVSVEYDAIGSDTILIL